MDQPTIINYQYIILSLSHVQTLQNGIIICSQMHIYMDRPVRTPYRITPLTMIKQQNNLNSKNAHHQSEHSPLYLKYGPLTYLKKISMIKKISQIVNRRHLSITPKAPDIKKMSRISNGTSVNHISKKRATITPDLISQLRLEFAQYDRRKNWPKAQRMTFRDISNKLYVSIPQVENLHKQYRRDPLFTQRLSKYTTRDTFTSSGRTMNGNAALIRHRSSNVLTSKRIKFIEALIRKKGPLTQRQVMDQMRKVPELQNKNKLTGAVKPILKKSVAHLMHIAKIKPQRVHSNQNNMLENDELSIKYRYVFAQRYLQLTEENAEIYFMGEYSFAYGNSLSHCHPSKYLQFVEGKPTTHRFKPDLDPSKHIQYMVVMSFQGIVYFQIYNNIYEDLNFPKALNNIGKAINRKNPGVKKYFILDTCFLHNKDDLRQFQSNFRISVVFIPPRTPTLNPVEYFFNQTKGVVKTKSTRNGILLKQTLEEYLTLVGDKQMLRFFYCIRPYIELSLKQQSFK